MFGLFASFFTWLTTLSLTWWQGLIFLLLISFVVIVLNYNKTKYVLRWIVGKRRKRSCIDCLTIMTGKRNKFDFIIKKIYKQQEKIENKILKEQMNFAEQKLVELETLFIDFYNDFIYNEKLSNIIQLGTLQYRMFSGLIRDALWLRIRDEIRRSFKENGYYEISGQEFSIYTKNQFNIIFSMLKQHIISLYPPTTDKIIVPVDKVLDFMKTINPKIEDKVFEIYIEAKKVKCEADKKIVEMEKQINEWGKKFHQEIDELIREK